MLDALIAHQVSLHGMIAHPTRLREMQSMADANLRDAILARLGRFPARVPLNLEFGPARDMGDHTRTLVSYAVESEERVDAWLLRPHGEPPPGGWPALLALHQHGGQFYLGKAEPAGLS